MNWLDSCAPNPESAEPEFHMQVSLLCVTLPGLSEAQFQLGERSHYGVSWKVVELSAKANDTILQMLGDQQLWERYHR